MKRVFTFNWRNAAFDYEPYPICYIPQILGEADYRDLADSYPPLELFRFMPDVGDKYSLAFRNNPDISEEALSGALADLQRSGELSRIFEANGVRHRVP